MTHSAVPNPGHRRARRSLLAAMLAVSACGFEGGSLAPSTAGDAALVDSGPTVVADAAPVDLCAPLSNTLTPLIYADFGSEDLTHVAVQSPGTASYLDMEQLIIRDNDREIGPCSGAWRFVQTPSRGGYIDIDGVASDSATIRAIVELPFDWNASSSFRDQAIITRSGALVAGRFELTMHKEPDVDIPSAVARIRLANNTYFALCSEPIDAKVIDLRLHMGEGDAAQMFWRPWLESTQSWGPFTEAATTDSRIAMLSAGVVCGVSSAAATVTQTSNTNTIAIGHSNHSNNAGPFNYMGWLSALEFYGERLDEPEVATSDM